MRFARQDPASVARVAATVALASFCAFHWANLITAPPVARVGVTVAILGLGAVALVRMAAERRPLRRVAGAGAIVLLTLAAALLAIGLPARLLFPGNWDELTGGIAEGIRGIGNVNYPYDEDDAWSRLVLLLALPALLGTATALAFWPSARRGTVLRGAALAIFIATYGVAAVLYAPGHPLLHGLILLTLVAAYLWAPRLRGWELALGTGVVLAAGAVALPLTSTIERSSPVLDYRHWTWAGGEASVVFQWNHTYDRLSWPRRGTALLDIASDSPHYWRVMVLESFDGYRWTRSPLVEDRLELPGQVEGTDALPNPDWETTTGVTVRELRSSLIVAPGAVESVDGLEESVADDGTAFAGELPETGQSYEVTAYAPDPSVEQMRAAADAYPAALSRFTALELPASRLGPDDTATLDAEDAAAAIATTPVQVPFRGRPLGAAREAIAASGYGGVLRVTQRLTRDAPTPYDAVDAIRRHLQHGFAYSVHRSPGDRPLRSFLLGTRRGYCQQFSGAMALMLRMAGIPSRVVTGFSPGAAGGGGDGAYTVRDTDAHSWVEVYFPEIGWVPFDPTPVAAPATAQVNPRAAIATPNGGGDGGGAHAREASAPQDSSTAVGGSSLVGWVLLVGLAGAGIAGFAVVLVRGSRFRALPAAEKLEREAFELHWALPRAGIRTGPGATLLELERRLRSTGRRRAADYALGLRDGRFAGGEAAPGSSQRRAVRRELSHGRGFATKLQLLLAMPPGGPARADRPG